MNIFVNPYRAFRKGLNFSSGSRYKKRLDTPILRCYAYLIKGAADRRLALHNEINENDRLSPRKTNCGRFCLHFYEGLNNPSFAEGPAAYHLMSLRSRATPLFYFRTYVLLCQSSNG